ncbi:MAG: hypothetical protein KAJ49_06310 [Arcobacteraceae bacterium]|nr:hypothetical protein [Arcobacteraceae bacterium]
MGFKKYIVASFLLLAIIAGYVYSLDIGNYNLVIAELNLNQTLPIAVWIITPAILLFIASLLHMIFYNTKSYFTKKTILKDIDNLSLVVKDRLLKKNSSAMLKTKELKEVGNILNQLDLNLINNNLTSSLNDITKISEQIIKIKKGEYINSNNLKLSEGNEIMKMNILNRVNNDDNFAIEVLKNSTKYDSSILEVAFKNIINNKSFATIKKLALNMKLTNNMVKLFLEKDSTSAKEFSLTNSEILVYVQDNKFTNNELIIIARNYKKSMSPEQLIKLFEDISAADETLTTSYLYVLFEYEMIVQIREILVNSQKDEYIIFKALLDLKDAGKHYSVDSLILK